MKRIAKFLSAVALLNAGLVAFVLSGTALILGQWAFLFGAISTDQAGSGIALVLAGFVVVTILQVAAVKLLASEEPWGWGWIALGMSPALIVAWHYGLFLLTLLLGGAIVFQVRKQVIFLRKKRIDSISS